MAVTAAPPGSPWFQLAVAALAFAAPLTAVWVHGLSRRLRARTERLYEPMLRAGRSRRRCD